MTLSGIFKVGDHVDHEWRKEGRCVYCVPCGLRLYQGGIPKDKRAHAKAMDSVFASIMKRWKDGEFDK